MSGARVPSNDRLCNPADDGVRFGSATRGARRPPWSPRGRWSPGRDRSACHACGDLPTLAGSVLMWRLDACPSSDQDRLGLWLGLDVRMEEDAPTAIDADRLVQ
jgi:hypothetical protein